jgi:hypothetical protein
MVARLPTKLKGLVETRARLGGEVARLEDLLADTTDKLKKARKSLSNTDATILHYNARLDPSAIRPVRGQKGRYGKHGTLKATIALVLAEAKGELVSYSEVAKLVIRKIGLKFASPEIQTAWKYNSLRSELNRMRAKGLVERELQANGKNTRWRLKPERKVTKLEDLKALRRSKRRKV